MPKLTDNDPMPCGKKYKGVAMINVPASYLDWIRRTWYLTPYNKDVLAYIQNNRDAINLELEKEQEENIRPIPNDD